MTLTILLRGINIGELHERTLIMPVTGMIDFGGDGLPLSRIAMTQGTVSAMEYRTCRCLNSMVQGSVR